MEERREYRLGGERSPARASLELTRLRLRLRRADAGRLRLQVGMRGEAGVGLPGAAARVELDCAVLVRPELHRGADGRVSLGASFAGAEVADLQVRRPWSGIRRSLDPLRLDPFSDERLAEAALRAARRILERVGERELRLGGDLLAWLTSVGGGPLGIQVEDRCAIVGYLGEEAALRFEGERWLARQAAAPLAPPLAASDPPLQLCVTDAYLTRLIEASGGPRDWRVSEPGVRVDHAGIEVAALVQPAHPRWPRGVRARVRARLRPLLRDERIALALDDLRVERPAALRPLGGVLRRAAEQGLSRRSWPRTRELRAPYGALRIVAVWHEPGLLSVAWEDRRADADDERG